GVDETEKPAMMGGSLHGKTLRRIEVQRRQLPLHEGLTRMKSLLIWPARFAETFGSKRCDVNHLGNKVLTAIKSPL
ncbi:hypothetical protein C9397_03655, partial [Xanthomonas vasicola pv. vasculorum]|uniref:hypothetical protein n=1 Tax=Xanthomonas vasicola TaxID=56459 RepID=UPI000518AFC3